MAHRAAAVWAGAPHRRGRVGWLAAAASTRATRATLAAASLALAVGALAWAWSVYLRGTRVAEFAFARYLAGRLPPLCR
jgi:hypothetical protein